MIIDIKLNRQKGRPFLVVQYSSRKELDHLPPSIIRDSISWFGERMSYNFSGYPEVIEKRNALFNNDIIYFIKFEVKLITRYELKCKKYRESFQEMFL